MSSPTARTLAELRKRGYLAFVAEKFNWHTKRRHDAFGFVDIIAIRGKETLGIQATSGSNVASRVTKIRTHENFPTVAGAWSVAVWGWSKRKPRGAKRARWALREVAVTVPDSPSTPAEEIPREEK